MNDDIEQRLEAQECEYEMGLEREREQAERINEQSFCRGCGKELLADNCWMDDGCPCNTERGVNDGNQIISEWRRDREQKAQHQLAALREQIAGLEGALKFYANADRYAYDVTCCPTRRNPGCQEAEGGVLEEGGQMARAALARDAAKGTTSQETDHA